MPPWLNGAAFHVPDRGNEGVQNTRIVTYASSLAQARIQDVRILSFELAWPVDSGAFQTLRERRTDVRNLLE
jgi:predicted NUDIX family NTP pyrophosphohydrolase